MRMQTRLPQTRLPRTHSQRQRNVFRRNTFRWNAFCWTLALAFLALPPLHFAQGRLFHPFTSLRTFCVRLAGSSILPPLQPSSLPSFQPSPLLLDARAGLDGYYKVNSWLPVHVIVANDGPDTDGEIQLAWADSGLEQPSAQYTRQITLPTRSRKRFTLYAFADSQARQLAVRLVARGKGLPAGAVLAEQTLRLEPLNAEDYLFVVVSDQPAALNYLGWLPSIGQQPGTGRAYVAHLALEGLPAQGRALGSVDAMILHRADSASLHDAQRDALRGWIAFGGHLVICGGPGAVPTAAGLGDLLPVAIQGTVTTTGVGALGDLAGTPLTAEVPAVVAQVRPLAGASPPVTVLAGEDDLPLLVRRTMDQGRIDYLALDPDMEPLRAWAGNGALWGQLLYPTPLAMRPGNAGFPSLGWFDQGTMSTVLADIPSLDLPPVLLVAGFLLAYIVIVGPLNFAILRLIDRRALAWISVPVLILLFSCAAYAIGYLSRGRNAVVSQITVVRAQPESQTASVDTLVGLYSPARRGYDVQLPADALVRPLASSPYGPASGDEPLQVEQGPPTCLRGFDVDVGAMRGFALHAMRPWPGIEADLALSRTAASAYHVAGTIANRSGANVQNAVLAFNAQWIAIGDLAAGTTQAIAADLRTAGSSSLGPLVDHLAGPPAAGSQGSQETAGREQKRRQAILEHVLAPYRHPRGSPPSSAVELDGLTLLGWLDKSPDQVDVGWRHPALNATTLLIAPLPGRWSASPGKEGQGGAKILVPKGSLNWQLSDGDPGMTPRELYAYQPTATFVFYLPNAQGMRVETLILHVDPLDGPTSVRPPVIDLKRWASPGDGAWASFTDLAWGENEIPDAQAFIRPDGGIELRVMAKTLNRPAAIDLSAIGTWK